MLSLLEVMKMTIRTNMYDTVCTLDTSDYIKILKSLRHRLG
jgi:hypothetical protein